MFICLCRCLLVLVLVFGYIEQNECSMEIAFKEYLKKIIAKKFLLAGGIRKECR